jgi:hypothetical protein
MKRGLGMDNLHMWLSIPKNLYICLGLTKNFFLVSPRTPK